MQLLTSNLLLQSHCFDVRGNKLWRFSCFTSVSFVVHSLLCVTTLLHGGRTIHLHEKEPDCKRGMYLISLFKLYWRERSCIIAPVLSSFLLSGALTLADHSSPDHLYPNSSITGWSCNLLPTEHLTSGFNMWRLIKTCSALIQWLTSTILCS